MKQLIIILSISAIAYSCGNNAEQTQGTKPAQEATPAENTSVPDPLRANPDYSKGLELIAKSDCFTCHRVDDINVGPSYRDVAGKYESNTKNISLLADKILKGGSGVWGQVPMTPHADLSKKDAEQMVKYIMLLKKHS
jgi:cytochrome c